jgi:hypothetical protein
MAATKTDDGNATPGQEPPATLRPDSWLTDIADLMSNVGHDDQDVTLVETAALLRQLDADHAMERESGKCQTCDDACGYLDSWPCAQWWTAFHFAMRWLMRQVGPAGPPCPCYPDGRTGWGERLACQNAGVWGRTEGATFDAAGRVQVPWQPPSEPTEPKAGRQREQAAERQRRKRERDRLGQPELEGAAAE